MHRFRKLGHEAYSCDIEPCSGGHPEWHIMQDVIPLLNENCTFSTCDNVEHQINGKWDMIIGFPPCTYLSNAGACRLYPKKGQLNIERYQKGLKAKAFFLKILRADCEKIAIENPVPSKIYELPEKAQVIQPYEYGEPYTKKTYLWLKGLPLLQPTNIVKPLGPYVCGNSQMWQKQAANVTVYGKEKGAKHRSKTFKGIAKAMAEQWGKELSE